MKKILALTALVLLLVVSMGPGIADTHGQDETPDTVSQVTGETAGAEPSPSPPPPSYPPSPTNQPPVAEAGPDRTVYVDVAIHFSGAGSHDPDGIINAYHWFFGDSGYKSGVKVMHVYEEAGNYTVTLSVTDNNGASSTDECRVTVHPMPVEPQAKIFETIPANHTGYVVDALDAANTTVTVNTTDTVTITVIKYESNPHPDDPMPATGIPKYADIYVSDPDAVDWPIYVEMTYTDVEIEGIDEASLGIYYWFNGTWKRCSDTGVDTENNVVWAYMTAEEASGSPILIAGILQLEPAEFVVSYPKIEPRQIELGGTVTISVNVTNVGETTGIYNVTLNVEEDLIISVKEITLQGGESEIVEFKFVPEAGGTYDVNIEGMIDTIYVIIPTPVPPYLSNLTVTPTEIEIGDNVTISLDIRNMGNQSFTYIVTMRIDELTLLVDVELESYEAKTVSHTMTPDIIGEYPVWVQGLTGSFTVKAPPLKPAEFVFSNLVIAPGDWLTIDETRHGFTISVDVTNIGEEMGGCTVELKVNDELVDSVDITPFGGGVTATQLFELTRGEGTYEVEVEGCTDSFTVSTPEPPFWMRPGIIAARVRAITVIIVVAAILYANWKGLLPKIPHNLNSNLDDERAHETRGQLRSFYRWLPVSFY